MEKKQRIDIPTRNNRLVKLYKSIKTPVVILAGVSSVTLAVAIIGFIASKLGFDGNWLPLIGVGLVAVAVAFYWEKTVAETWTEFTRQIVNWEFEGRYQIILGIVIFIIPIVMAAGSVAGSIFGGYDIAEVTAGEVELADVSAVASSLSDGTNAIDASYSKQISDLQKQKKEAIAVESALHDVLIKDNNSKAWKAKKEGKTDDYNWLSGGKRSTLLKAKQKAIARIATKYDDMISDVLDAKNKALEQSNNQSSAVLTSTIQKNNTESERHKTKKERHEIGLTWLAAVSSPLYLVLILIASLIEVNIGSISENDLPSVEEIKHKRQHKHQHKPTQTPTQTKDSTQTNKRVVVVPQHTQPKTERVLLDYTQTKSSLNTYIKRLEQSGFSDKRMEGVKRYANRLINAGYKVKMIDGRLAVDAKDSPTLPEGTRHEINYSDNTGIVFRYSDE